MINIKEDDIHVHEEILQTHTIDKTTVVNNNQSVVKSNLPSKNMPSYASTERFVSEE